MINRVTLTGADDKTTPETLVELSREFPFVEWGILVSAQRRKGTSRFPGEDWMAKFSDLCQEAHEVQVSMHVCGSWVRQMLRGQMDWKAFPVIRDVADRIQINTHAEEHISTVSALDWIAERSGRQFIVQLDAVNDHFLDAAVSRKLNVAGLFDRSHGAGVLPDRWPQPRNWSVYHGYSGGLGPENVAEQVAKIEAGNSLPYWIDMEGRVRTDEVFDLSKVRKVLELCAPLVVNRQ